MYVYMHYLYLSVNGSYTKYKNRITYNELVHVWIYVHIYIHVQTYIYICVLFLLGKKGGIEELDGGLGMLILLLMPLVVLHFCVG
jgi:hypothetical protein